MITKHGFYNQIEILYFVTFDRYLEIYDGQTLNQLENKQIINELKLLTEIMVETIKSYNSIDFNLKVNKIIMRLYSQYVLLLCSLPKNSPIKKEIESAVDLASLLWTYVDINLPY